MFSELRLLPIFILLGGLAYGYHWVIIKEKDRQIADLQQQVLNLTSHNAALQLAEETNIETIDGLELDLKQQKEQYTKLSANYSAIETEVSRMTRIFSKHNLTYLAREKPGLIEPRINNGTKQVFEQITQDSKELENENSTPTNR